VRSSCWRLAANHGRPGSRAFRPLYLGFLVFFSLMECFAGEEECRSVLQFVVTWHDYWREFRYLWTKFQSGETLRA